eukprot:sb/3473702/
MAQRLTASSLDWESSIFTVPDWELNESSSTKGNASDIMGFSKLQDSVTASRRTTSVEDARSVNRHPQTRSGGAGERVRLRRIHNTLICLAKLKMKKLTHIHTLSNYMFAKGKLPLVRPEVHTPAHTPAQIGGKLCRGHPKICMALSN